VTEANGSQVEFVPWRSQKEKALSLPLLIRMHRGATKPFSVADEAVLKQRHPTLLGMAKTNISTADLVWVFMEKLKSFGDCSPGISIAIVPSKDGWSTIASRRGNHAHPLCAKRIEQVQGELREIYVLAKD
jgi:hypothetical protein